jgi:hypothetical protein
MTDEEAFRVFDLENRARENLTDFERAADYLLAQAGLGPNGRTKTQKITGASLQAVWYKRGVRS